MPDYMPSNEFELLAWLQNFNTVAAANTAALGLVAADVTASSAATATFGTSLSDMVTKSEAAKAATADKNTDKASSVIIARSLVNRIQAHPGVSDGLKKSLGITVRDTIPTPNAPQQPMNLAAVGLPSGTNKLEWKANGNTAGVQYRIEMHGAGNSNWSLVDVATKTKYNHTGNTPGVQLTYRVVARRNGTNSEPSNEATVYSQPQQQAA